MKTEMLKAEPGTAVSGVTRPTSGEDGTEEYVNFGGLAPDEEDVPRRSSTAPLRPVGNAEMWQALEKVHGQCGVRGTWHQFLGDQFERFQSAFLRRREDTAEGIHCEECLCAHTVITHADGKRVGVCECDPWNCDDMHLTDEDVALWELNWTKLGRAVARALDCDYQEADFLLPGTRPIGTFGGAKLPVVLSVVHGRMEFRRVAAELSARMRDGYVVLAPTGTFVDMHALELLNHARAGFFDLASHVTLPPNGTLQARRSGAVLFAPYLINKRQSNGEKEAAQVVAAGRSGRENTGSRTPPAEMERVTPRYSLRKGLRTWELVFQGRAAPIDDGRGVQIVAYLLRNPPVERIHAIQLERLVWADGYVDEPMVSRAREEEADLEANLSIRGEVGGVARCQDDNTILKHEVRELLAIIRDGTLPTGEREEAQARLEAISRSLSGGGGLAGEASKAAGRLRKAINRLQAQLAGARNEKNEPHPVLREFAEHLRKHLIVPSARFTKSKTSRNKAGVAGTFTYEPPADVVWEDARPTP